MDRAKKDKLLSGQEVVTNDEELNVMLDSGSDPDDIVYDIRTRPNPSRAGTKDQYIGWIGG